MDALRILNLTLNIIGTKLNGKQCLFYHEFVKPWDLGSCSWIHFEFFYRYIEWCPCNTLLMPMKVFRF